jgi:hypothetical protein
VQQKLKQEPKQHKYETKEETFPYVPLVKREATKPIRDAMKQLHTEMVAAHGTLNAEQVEQLRSLELQERDLIAQELIQVSALYESLRALVYDLSARYRNIYFSVNDMIRKTEADALAELDTLVETLEPPVAHPVQTAGELLTIMGHAYNTKTNMFDPFMTSPACASSPRA